MEFNVFDGGLSRRLDAQFVKPNEGVTYHNCNIYKGVLQSISDDKVSGFGDRGIRPFWWRGSIYHNSEDATFVEFDRRMFKNTNGVVQVTDFYPVTEPIQWKALGTDAPDETFQVDYIQWPGQINIVTDVDLGNITTPRPTDNFLMVVDNVYHRVDYEFPNQVEPFYLEFILPQDDKEHKLYHNKGNDVFVEMATSTNAPINFGYDDDGVGLPQFGDHVTYTVGNFNTDTLFTAIGYDDSMSVEFISYTGGVLNLKLVRYALGEGVDLIKEYSLEVSDGTDPTDIQLDMTIASMTDRIVVRFLSNYIADITFDFNGNELAHRILLNPKQSTYKHLITQDFIYMFIDGFWLYRYSTNMADTAFMIVEETLERDIGSTQTAIQYFELNSNWYGLVKTYNSTHLEIWKYIIGDGNWSKDGITEFSGVPIGYTGASNNLVTNGYMHIMTEEGLVLHAGADQPTFEVGKPVIEYPIGFTPFYSMGDILENDNIYMLYTYSRNATGDAVFFGTKINIDLTYTRSVTGDLLPRENLLYGAYTYATAYANGDASQSPLSATTESIDIPYGNVRVTFDQGMLDDIPVDGELILFRTFGSGGQYYEVTRWDSAGAILSYIDNTHDADLLSPPTNVGGGVPPEGLNYLTEHRGRLYGAVDTKLYFSEYGDVHNWPPTNFLVFPEEIKALGSVSNGLIVFSESTTHLLLGTSLVDYQTRPIDKRKGCSSFKSLVGYKGGVIYVDDFSIYMTNGGDISNLGFDKLNLKGLLGEASPEVLDSLIIRETYILLFRSLILVMDMNGPPKFFTMSRSDNLMSISSYNDFLFGHYIDGQTLTLTEGTGDRQLEYRSGDVVAGAVTNLKEYDRIRIVFSGTFLFRLYMDDIVVVTQEITSPTKVLETIGISNLDNMGTSMAYSLIGTGIVYGVEIKPVGRSNNP